MISVSFDDTKFFNDLTNFIKYSNGFVEGITAGKKEMLKNLAKPISEILKKYIDSEARADELMLHHVYEWYNVASPNARLFDVKYVITETGISFSSTFRQSSSIKNGSTVPFYDKARIMEQGIPVTIKPNKRVLAFEDNGETVFTSSPVKVDNPGGDQVAGSYEKTFNSFFENYFSQSFLNVTGIKRYLENPLVFKKELHAAKTGGRSLGFRIGYNWIASAGIGVTE